MRITPLVLHAAMMLPRHTGLFSDILPVASLSVVVGGLTTITTSAAHGVPVNTQIAVSVIEAETPNPVTAASVLADGDVLLTVQYPHNLTGGTPDNGNCPWSVTAKLSGFSNALLNGTLALVDTPTPTTIVVRPSSSVPSVTLNGAEKLFEVIDGEIIGWHAVTAATTTTLTFPTPSSVTRSFAASNIRVARNARVFGALDVETALAHFTREDADTSKAHMFVCPQTVRALGKTDRADPSMFTQQMLDDGFIVLALMPSRGTTGQVACIDLAQGELFRAVLRTFYGLQIQRPELAAGAPYTAVFESHSGGAAKSNAIYGHQYVFSVPAYLTNADQMKPWESAVIDVAALATAQTAAQSPNGSAPLVLPPDLVTLDTPVPFRGLDFSGILHDGAPQPLTASIEIPS